jgi:hypothetical protein
VEVWIKVLDLPELVDLFGARGFSFSFSGETLQEFLKALEVHYGSPFSRIVFDAEGRLNQALQILVQGKLCAQPLASPNLLQEGDHVAFVAFLEGG